MLKHVSLQKWEDQGEELLIPVLMYSQSADHSWRNKNSEDPVKRICLYAYALREFKKKWSGRSLKNIFENNFGKTNTLWMTTFVRKHKNTSEWSEARTWD